MFKVHITYISFQLLNKWLYKAIKTVTVQEFDSTYGYTDQSPIGNSEIIIAMTQISLTHRYKLLRYYRNVNKLIRMWT